MEKYRVRKPWPRLKMQTPQNMKTVQTEMDALGVHNRTKCMCVSSYFEVMGIQSKLFSYFGQRAGI